MSDYPKWWADTITIYNRYQDPLTDVITWTRTVLTNCFFKNTNNKVTINQTVLETNSTVVRIPQNSNYRPYAEWIALANDIRGSYFTLHAGDIIVKGIITDTINEYVKTQNSNALVTKYKSQGACLVINTFEDNSGVGRGVKHYRVVGE